MYDRDGKWYPDPPTDPVERALWRTRYFAQNYGIGKRAIADLFAERPLSRADRFWSWCTSDIGWKIRTCVVGALMLVNVLCVIVSPSVVTFGGLVIAVGSFLCMWIAR